MKRPSATRTFVLRLLAVFCVLVGGFVLGLWLRGADVPAERPVPSTSPASPSPSPTPTPRPYSLTIPAQRAVSYAASPVAPEGGITARDGYREQTISFYSGDLREYAQVVLPETRQPAEGYPAIILVHGYVPASDYQTDESFYTGVAAGFARQGFAVVKPDLRGHGRSWGVAEGAYYSAGYVADVLNLRASLQNYDLINAGQVSLMGHSMGAHVALDAAVVRPEAFRTVILAAGSVGRFTDMYSGWRANSDFGNPVTLGIRQRVINLFGEPSDDDFWRSVDPYQYLGDLKSPIFVAHDSDDDTVPYRFSGQLDAALTDAGRRHSFKTYLGGHSFIALPDTPFTGDALAFIRQHSPGLVTPVASPNR